MERAVISPSRWRQQHKIIWSHYAQMGKKKRILKKNVSNKCRRWTIENDWLAESSAASLSLTKFVCCWAKMLTCWSLSGLPLLCSWILPFLWDWKGPGVAGDTCFQWASRRPSQVPAGDHQTTLPAHSGRDLYQGKDPKKNLRIAIVFWNRIDCYQSYISFTALLKILSSLSSP